MSGKSPAATRKAPVDRISPVRGRCTQPAPYARATGEVLSELGVEPQCGLSTVEVHRRQQHYGPNLLRQKRKTKTLVVLARQFKGLFVLLLSAAAALSFAFGEHEQGIAIVVVIAVNAAIGFFAEIKAVRSMEALRRLARVATKVRRDGCLQEVPAQALVPGDLVALEAGDIVTADLRTVEGASLSCDESVLTGESLPVGKSTQPVRTDTPLAERSSMLFKGTALVRGSGTAVVVGIGMNTELGRISALTEAAEDKISPLEKRLDALSSRLAWVTLAVATLICMGGILAGKSIALMIQTGVALAVAAVPEGLPIVATLALSRGMWRMQRKNALIERLSAVETLGATTVIFADKTGTLTENRMQVVKVVTAQRSVELPGDRSRPHEVVREALRIAALCNDAELGRDADRGSRASSGAGVGDPLEVALLQAAATAGQHRQALVEALPRVKEVPFDATVKLMATVHRNRHRFLFAVKGAPEEIIARCTHLRSDVDGQGRDTICMDDALRTRLLARNAGLASEGLRVLAVASKRQGCASNPPFEDLTFIALLGLMDPHRADVPSAVAACRDAGIRVIMATGDQPLTAKAIAAAVGLGGDAVNVMHGKDVVPLRAMTPPVREQLLGANVFARLSPEQKLELVRLYQEAGEVVAMTGDGVNDAPALKSADIGVAMGRRGSQVAREAADMVLIDDAFPSIVAAVEQGRVIFGNIRRFVIYLLSCNLSEILIVSVAAVGGTPLPLLPLQILYLNLVTDVFPAFALGAGEGEAGVMHRPPRAPAEPVVTRAQWAAIVAYAIAIATVSLGAFAFSQTQLGLTVPQAVTVCFITLAFAQLVHVLSMRDADSHPVVNEVTRNRYVWGAVVLCIGLVLAATHWRVLRDVLHLEPLGVQAWLLAGIAALGPWIVSEAVKAVMRLAAVKRPGAGGSPAGAG
ncbi:MAG: cation-translocating P-type ATPase [Gammaproteobacteria bacterium]